MRNWAVIVAAGKGVRAGFARNKVYMNLSGKSVLSSCVERLNAPDALTARPS